MNPKTQDKLLKFAGIGMIVGLVLGFVVPHFRSPPPVDETTRAYALILVGMKAGRYEAAKAKFDEAYSICNDSELQYLAEYFSKNCQLALDAGVHSYEEENSLEGGIKAFVSGFILPMNSVAAWSQLAKKYLGDFDKNCAIVDSRYLPKVQAYFAARDHNSQFAWGWLVASILGFAVYGLVTEDKNSKPRSVSTTETGPDLKLEN